jgi:5-formyltetrahydrofolate cyclo-ligase
MSAEELANQKQALRKTVLANRARGHDCGHAHSQLLIDYSWELRAKTIACYLSFGDEPSTTVFIKHCLLGEKTELYAPRVIGEELEWVLMGEEQATHPLGMSEPIGAATSLTEVDLMVIPALAADRTGNRLGRGKGYYDRALKQIRAKKIIVLVHDDELFDQIPIEGHDVQVTAICSCSEIIGL